jgi:hypothetical protein
MGRLHFFANFGCGSACAICKCVQCALGFSFEGGRKKQNKCNYSGAIFFEKTHIANLKITNFNQQCKHIQIIYD